MSVISFNFLLIFVVTVFPSPSYLTKLINFKPVPSSFKWKLFLLSIINFIVIICWDSLFIKRFIIKFLSPKVMKWRGRQHLYDKIAADVKKHGISNQSDINEIKT